MHEYDGSLPVLSLRNLSSYAHEVVKRQLSSVPIVLHQTNSTSSHHASLLPLRLEERSERATHQTQHGDLPLAIWISGVN